MANTPVVVPYAGPWDSAAYGAATQLANGRSGVPYDSATIDAGYRILGQIPPSTAPTTPSPSSVSGSVAPAPVFNRAGVANTQLTIDQIPALLAAALASESTNHSNTVNGFNSAEGVQRDNYGKSTVTNQQNYDSNLMSSILAGIHGFSGLMALLRGTGAAGGTAQDVARDTVGGVTANDIRTGADTQKENQGQLDNSFSTFLTDLKQKRQVAEDTFTNNKSAINRDSETQLQDLYGKMAGFYGDVGNSAAANDWTNRAGALTPDIASNSKTQVSPYDTTPVAVQAPKISAFSAPTQPSITTVPDNQVGSGIFTLADPRRKNQTPALAGA